MNIGAARSELHKPPRVNFPVLAYEMLAVLVVCVGMVELLG